MSCVFDREFILEQIALLKGQLAANVAAMAEARKAQSYHMDTGQTRQSVTRMHISQLRRERDAILNELAIWEGYLCPGSHHIRPAW